jgi:N-acyl amino acid synthase of PEP-CTERM/exosortase system
VRLVLPHTGHADSLLPCQIHLHPLIPNHHHLDFNGAHVGEISRLAVPGNFRRRVKAVGKPLFLDNHNTNAIYTEEERRNFPNISIGLYLSAIALVDLCGLERVLAVMEPRLQRHLQRFGLVFHQISDPFELHGRRALFELPVEELTVNMNEYILELFRNILQVLEQQIDKMLQLHYDALQSNDHAERPHTLLNCEAFHRRAGAFQPPSTDS